MKKLVVTLFLILAVVLGLYVGGWLIFIGGIVSFFEGVTSNPIVASKIAWGVVGFFTGGPIGWFIFTILSSIGIGISTITK